MIHGPLDVDQLDYLLRDSHYTGAVHGVIDIERLLQTVEIHNGDLVITKGGIPAVEGMLVARGLMYSSVYFHKTARIAELMLTKAVDDLDEPLEDIYEMNDWELLSTLKAKGGFQEEIVDRLKYRRLYKRCYSLESEDIEDADGIDPETIGQIDQIRDLEKRIAGREHVDVDNVLVDVPHEELKLSEPRLTKTGIKILDQGKLSNLSSYSPLARALQKRPTQPWALMVSCPAELRDDMERAAEKEIIGV